MTEWPNQITEIQRNLVEQQQKLLSDWIDTMQGSAGSTAPQIMWQQAVDVMEQQINNTLDSQKQTLLSLASNMEEVEGTPEPVSQWLHQIEQGIEIWDDVQHRLWQDWFDMFRAATPQASQSAGESMLSNWQELARKSMAIQEEWLSSWTDTQKTSKQAAGSTSTRSTTSKQPSKAKTGNKKKAT